MAENLNVKVTGSGERRLVLLHGLFGSANNLGQLARAFKEDYVVYSVDLPDHGKSPWLSEASVQVYAQVLAAWLAENEIGQSRVIGHSLGGKVAMQLALDFPSLVEKLVVLDIAPVAYPSRHDAVFSALNAVREARVGSRSEARAIMQPLLEDIRIADFLLTSAHISSEGYVQWRFNLNGLRIGYESILGAISARCGRAKPFSGPTLVVRGELSDYVTDESARAFSPLFSSFDMVTVRGAGHWLHQEEPVAVSAAVRQFFDAEI